MCVYIYIERHFPGNNDLVTSVWEMLNIYDLRFYNYWSSQAPLDPDNALGKIVIHTWLV